MTTRRAVVHALGATLVAVPFVSRSQQASTTARIGWLAPNPGGNATLPEAFVGGLRDLGYVEGRNLAIESRIAHASTDELPMLAADLVARRVDVIVTVATRATLSAMRATSRVPIVFVAVGDPLTSGFVASLARPGGNATGFALLFPELVAKCLEHLKEAAPGIGRVAVLWQPGVAPDRSEKLNLEQVDAAGRALGVRLQFVAAGAAADLEAAFAKIGNLRTDAVTVMSTPMFTGERARLATFAVNNRLPTVFQFRHYVDAGGLMSYGPDLRDMFRRAAGYVDKILRGAKPGDLPVEQPAKFELVVNLATASALGLKIPASLLARADDVVR